MTSTKRNSERSSDKQPAARVRPNNLAEMLNDPYFNKALKGSIDGFDLAGRFIPKAGTRYKRTPIDYLKENNLFNADFFKMEFYLIQRKQSGYSSAVRGAISHFVGKAINSTLKYYAEKEKRATKKAGAVK